MTDYIEREAAINGITKIISKSDMPEDSSKGMIAAMSTLYRIPAADVRLVVTCGECKHWETNWTPRGVSDGRHYCAPLHLYPSADWFCADGPKREES